MQRVVYDRPPLAPELVEPELALQT